MANLKNRIWKQHNIGGWGRFALAASQLSIFVSALTFLMVGVNTYEPVSVWLAGYGIHLRFWMFFGAIIIPLIVAYYLAWRYLVVSFYRSSTEQFWEQSKVLTEKLAKLDRLENIEQMLNKEFSDVKSRLEALERK